MAALQQELPAIPQTRNALKMARTKVSMKHFSEIKPKPNFMLQDKNTPNWQIRNG